MAPTQMSIKLGGLKNLASPSSPSRPASASSRRPTSARPASAGARCAGAVPHDVVSPSRARAALEDAVEIGRPPTLDRTKRPNTGRCHVPTGPANIKDFPPDTRYTVRDALRQGEECRDAARHLLAMGSRSDSGAGNSGGRNSALGMVPGCEVISDPHVFAALDVSRLNETRHNWQRIDTFQTPGGPADPGRIRPSKGDAAPVMQDLMDAIRCEFQVGVSQLREDFALGVNQTISEIRGELHGRGPVNPAEQQQPSHQHQAESVDVSEIMSEFQKVRAELASPAPMVNALKECHAQVIDAVWRSAGEATQRSTDALREEIKGLTLHTDMSPMLERLLQSQGVQAAKPNDVEDADGDWQPRLTARETQARLEVEVRNIGEILQDLTSLVTGLRDAKHHDASSQCAARPVDAVGQELPGVLDEIRAALTASGRSSVQAVEDAVHRTIEAIRAETQSISEKHAAGARQAVDDAVRSSMAACQAELQNSATAQAENMAQAVGDAVRSTMAACQVELQNSATAQAENMQQAVDSAVRTTVAGVAGSQHASQKEERAQQPTSMSIAVSAEAGGEAPKLVAGAVAAEHVATASKAVGAGIHIAGHQQSSAQQIVQVQHAVQEAVRSSAASCNAELRTSISAQLDSALQSIDDSVSRKVAALGSTPAAAEQPAEQPASAQAVEAAVHAALKTFHAQAQDSVAQRLIETQKAIEQNVRAMVGETQSSAAQQIVTAQQTTSAQASSMQAITDLLAIVQELRAERKQAEAAAASTLPPPMDFAVLQELRDLGDKALGEVVVAPLMDELRTLRTQVEEIRHRAVAQDGTFSA